MSTGDTTNLITSFFVSDKPGNSSSIKFGDYDVECAIGKDQNQFTYFATKGLTTWALKGYSVGLGSVSSQFSGDFDFLISPHLPYAYMPEKAHS